MATTIELLNKRCTHQATALDDRQIAEYLTAIDGWALEAGAVSRIFSFKNYYETIAFMNAIAYVFHAEDHHPELVVTYNRCTVKLNTHSVNNGRGGISENDFICAAKVNEIFCQAAH